MPDLRRRNCQRCRKPSSEVGPISWRGNCRPCGLEREREAIVQLAEHEGPVFDYWRQGMAGCVGATIPDTAPTTS
jgi:hypothetical protein